MVNNIRVMPSSGVVKGDYIESDNAAGRVTLIDQFEDHTEFTLDTGESLTVHSNSLVMVIS